MIKKLSFVAGGMVVNADKVERGSVDGMVGLFLDDVLVGSIDLDLSRLKVLHLYKSDNYINVSYSVDYK